MQQAFDFDAPDPEPTGDPQPGHGYYVGQELVSRIEGTRAVIVRLHRVTETLLIADMAPRGRPSAGFHSTAQLGVWRPVES